MSRPWMAFYPADYLKDTRHLTPAQHGAYLLLIMEYWIKGSLPEQDRQLARIVGMRVAEWRETKSVIQPFFHDGWKHTRLDKELAKAEAKHSARQEAGKKGGHAKAAAKQKPSNALASSSEPDVSSLRSETDSASLRSAGADAPSDPRTRLFRQGLETLAKITGKGPDACRAFIGKCLKAAQDDAIVVLGLIEDAERNRVANPSAWIAAHLKGANNEKGGLLDAIDRALAKTEADLAASADTVQRLPQGPVR